MVLVDIYVPSIDKTYDFQLNDAVQIEDLIDEISEMIGNKEQTEIVGDVSKLQLYDKRNEHILSKKASLSEYGIKNGDNLIFI